MWQHATVLAAHQQCQQCLGAQASALLRDRSRPCAVLLYTTAAQTHTLAADPGAVRVRHVGLSTSYTHSSWRFSGSKQRQTSNLRACVQEYVRARLVQFAEAFAGLVNPSLTPQHVRQAAADAISSLPIPRFGRVAFEDRDLQLVFRHDCLCAQCRAWRTDCANDSSRAAWCITLLPSVRLHSDMQPCSPSCLESKVSSLSCSRTGDRHLGRTALDARCTLPHCCWSCHGAGRCSRQLAVSELQYVNTSQCLQLTASACAGAWAA